MYFKNPSLTVFSPYNQNSGFLIIRLTSFKENGDNFNCDVVDDDDDKTIKQYKDSFNGRYKQTPTCRLSSLCF